MSRVYSTFTTSGTYTVPAGIIELIIVCYGGGGAGILGTVLNGGIPGPGGGGGASSKKTISVTPGSSVTYTIGAGGSISDSAGGDTSAVYSASTICLAKGGAKSADGSSGGLGGASSGGTGDYKVSGGNGSPGDGTYGGGGGSCGSCSAVEGDLTFTQAGNAGGLPTGGAATTLYTGTNGAGGAGGQSGHVAGYVGGNYGGGGGGTSPLGSFDSGDQPGAGASGFIEISYALIDAFTYDETATGGILAGGARVVRLISTKTAIGGAVVGGKIQKYEGGGGGPSVAVCSPRGSGTATGKLAQIQVSNSTDDGSWTYYYGFADSQLIFGSTTPIS